MSLQNENVRFCVKEEKSPVSDQRAARPSGDPWIARTAIEPQIGGALGAEYLAPGAATLRGLRTHPGRALGPGICASDLKPWWPQG